jgi:hypothetical protein
MMSLLTRRHAEAKRLLELYTAYKDSDDDWRRRKAHIDLDRFLMENRETAIMCIEQVLSTEIAQLVAEQKKKTKMATKILRPPWYQRLAYRLQRRGEDSIVKGEQDLNG